MKFFTLFFVLFFSFAYTLVAQNTISNEQVSELSKDNSYELTIPASSKLAADTSFEKVFIDEFLSTGKWAEEDNLNSTLQRKGGHYLFNNKRNVLYSSYMPIGLNTKKNFATQTALKHIEGSNYYGLMVGGEETDGILFLINPDTRSYWILFNNQSGSTDYFKRENSVVVSKDINVLRTEKIGFKQRFFINDFYIGEINFVELIGNKHGFIIDGKGIFSAEYFKIQWGN